MLVTDVRQERSLTRLTRLDDEAPETIEQLFSVLEAEVLEDLARERFPPEQMQTQRFAGMRYRGQSYEVAVPVSRVATQDDIAGLRHRFHEAHLRRYGHMAEAEAIEIVNFKVGGAGVIAKPVLAPSDLDRAAKAVAVEHRAAYFGGDSTIETPVFYRDNLAPGTEVDGPAVIEETTSTVVIYPGHRARVDAYLNLEIEVTGT